MTKNIHVINKIYSLKENSKFNKLIHIGLLGITFLFILSLSRNIYNMRISNERITEAQRQLQALQDQNQQLVNEVTVVESDYYKEKLGRDKLGLAKEGEVIAVLPPEDELRKLSPKLDMQEENILPKPNWRRWLDLFVN